MDSLTGSETSPVEEAIAVTLENLQETEPELVDGKIPNMLVRGFNSKDPKVKREALIKLRKAGYESQPVIDTGLVPDILLLLDSKDEEEKSEALWILTNVSAGTVQQCETLVNAGALPKLIANAISSHVEEAKSSLWVLGNLIQGSAALRDRFREAGGVDALMEVMAKGNTANSDVQGQMAFVIDSFLSERSVPRVPRQVAESFTPWLIRYITETPVDPLSIQVNGSLTDAVTAFDKIRHMRLLSPKDLIETGTVPRLVELLQNAQSSIKLRLGALRCIRYLTDGDFQDIDQAIDAGIIPASLSALESGDHSMIQNACWAATNIITRGQKRQVDILFDSDLVIQIAGVLAIHDHPKAQNQALSVVRLVSERAYHDERASEVLQKGLSSWARALSRALGLPRMPAQYQAITALSALLDWMDLKEDKTTLPLLIEHLVPQALRAVRDSQPPSHTIRTRCHRLLVTYFPDFSRRARV